MKLAILDRDGVINFDSDQYIKSPSEWRPIPGSIEAIARLNQHGYRIAVATNQSGIGRRAFDRRQPEGPAGGRGRRRATDPRAHRQGQGHPGRGRIAEEDARLRRPRRGEPPHRRTGMTELRSVLFLLGALAITAPFGILVPAGRLFGREPPFTLARLYTKVMLRWVEISCGIRYEVSGWEHVPKTPVVIMSKH